MKRRTFFVAVCPGDLIRVPKSDRRRVICRIAQKRLHVAGPRTHIYIRTNRGKPDAVILTFGNAVPDIHQSHIEYVPALEYLQQHETLASVPARE